MSEFGRHLFDPFCEIWRDLPWFEKYYQVSTYGRIKTKPRVVKNRHATREVKSRLLRPYSNKYGFKMVMLTVKGQRYMRYVHRVVAEAFLGDVDGYMVEFLDGDRSNVYLINLNIRNDVASTYYAHEIVINKRKGLL